MIIFYNIFALLIYLLAIPLLLFKVRDKKYKDSIPSRFFLKKNPKFKKNLVWFHCCSFGEVRAIKPILEQLKEKINLTVITNTGFDEGQKLTDNIRYLPFEIFLPFWITKQKVLVVVEAELWLNLFYFAKKKGIKTILINARISDKSYKNYKKFSFFYKKIFENIDIVFAQSEVDKDRLIELGAKKVIVNGNIKLVNLPKVTKKYTKPNGLIITAASTHENEEGLILNSWNKIGKLIIVPRHPERFDEVFDLIRKYAKKNNLTFHRFSQKNDFNSDIVLIDLMGELINIYAISDVVILGGSFIDSAGGHNPIEPAYFNVVLISGKTIFNQKSLFSAIKNYYLIEKDELKDYLNNINNLKKSMIGEKGEIESILNELKNINL